MDIAPLDTISTKMLRMVFAGIIQCSEGAKEVSKNNLGLCPLFFSLVNRVYILQWEIWLCPK